MQRDPNNLQFFGFISPKGASESISVAVEGDFKSPEELDAIKSLLASIKAFQPKACKLPMDELRKQASTFMDWSEPLPQSLQLVGIESLFMSSVCFAPSSAADLPQIDCTRSALMAGITLSVNDVASAQIPS